MELELSEFYCYVIAVDGNQPVAGYFPICSFRNHPPVPVVLSTMLSPRLFAQWIMVNVVTLIVTRPMPMRQWAVLGHLLPELVKALVLEELKLLYGDETAA